MVAGGAIYRDQCSACDGLQGKGVPALFPLLAESTLVRSGDPTALVRIVLRGARSVATDSEPTARGMPSYAWQLDDTQVPAVLTYVRNAWARPRQPFRPRTLAVRAAISWSIRIKTFLFG
jgi:mono/diheme cytochrome c family protein